MNTPSHNAPQAPQSLETERSILGAILINNSSVNAVIDLGLKPNDFYLDFHRKVFSLILSLSEKNKPIDLVTLTVQAKDQGWYEQMGGSAPLLNLFDEGFRVGNIETYVEIIKNKATLRSIIQIASEMTEDAVRGVPDTDDFLDEVERKVFSISDDQLSKSSSSIGDIFMENLQSIEEMALKKSDVTGLGTGFHEFDRMTGGLSPGQLMILAARPAMGKTSLFLSICRNIVTHDPKAVVAIFSLEMTKSELGFRLLSSAARVPSQRLKVGNLTSSEWADLTTASSTLSQSKMEINDCSDSTVLDIKARCRRILAKEKRLDIIVIDYLQLMKGSKSAQKGEGTREREVSEISRNLKSLAKELKVPIVALSQLNRSLENRPNKRPLLSDLRESGSIEADADLVVFIHREEVYNSDCEARGQAELIVAKHRAGATGTIHLKWIPEFTLFTNLIIKR